MREMSEILSRCPAYYLIMLFLNCFVHAQTYSIHDSNRFPPGFMIGCASSAYQVEGAWNEDGKGENIWDHLVHTEPWRVNEQDNGDVACDSYHKYCQDVQMVKDIGFNHYRFSLSWSRILPTGFDNVINQAGVDYYHRLIDDLIDNGITPVVTIYHFDLPQPLQELGGWPNPVMADYYEQYARVVFREFGNKVKYWITINEPTIAALGYDMPFLAPILVNINGVGSYLSIYTMLLAHARAYHLYDREFRPHQHGKIGMTTSSQHFYPKTNSRENIDAAYRAIEFQLGIVSHPIFSAEGDFPPVVRERVDTNSRLEGRSHSRLPTFTPEQIRMIRGSADFFGLNHYTTHLAEDGLSGMDPSVTRDSGAISSDDPSWIRGMANWQSVVPSGFRSMLNAIRVRYNNPPVFVFENGFSTNGNESTVEEQLNDDLRVQYYHDYMQEMLKAMYIDGCNVIGYTAWSIMDNFEFLSAYSVRFGIYYVDFDDPARPRIKKKSAEYFKKVIQAGSVLPTSCV